MSEMFKPNQALQIVQEERVVELPKENERDLLKEESEISGLEELLSDWVS